MASMDDTICFQYQVFQVAVLSYSLVIGGVLAIQIVWTRHTAHYHKRVLQKWLRQAGFVLCVIVSMGCVDPAHGFWWDLSGSSSAFFPFAWSKLNNLLAGCVLVGCPQLLIYRVYAGTCTVALKPTPSAVPWAFGFFWFLYVVSSMLSGLAAFFSGGACWLWDAITSGHLVVYLMASSFLLAFCVIKLVARLNVLDAAVEDRRSSSSLSTRSARTLRHKCKRIVSMAILALVLSVFGVVVFALRTYSLADDRPTCADMPWSHRHFSVLDHSSKLFHCASTLLIVWFCWPSPDVVRVSCSPSVSITQRQAQFAINNRRRLHIVVPTVTAAISDEHDSEPISLAGTPRLRIKTPMSAAQREHTACKVVDLYS